MDILEELLERFMTLEDALIVFFQDLMQDPFITNQMLQWNQDQLNEGKRSDDSFISPRYKGMTIAQKKIKGQPFDKVTLRDTGDFQEGIRIKIADNKAEFFGTNWKTLDLEIKYNNGQSVILGLNEEHIQRLREIIAPDILSFTRNYLTVK